MKTTIAAIILALAAGPALAQTTTNTQSFYDSNGSFAGSSSSHGNSTSFSDRNGHFSGSAIRNSNGTTSVYDARGHFTGSSVNTSPQHGNGRR
jgi:hypothetical protein